MNAKRELLSHDAVMRIIQGACFNATAAHPNWFMDPRLARSIAKRATGTLLAAMSSTLAAPSVQSDMGASCCYDAPLAGNPSIAPKKGSGLLPMARAAWRPFRRLVAQMATYSRQIDDMDRATTCEDILGLFDAECARMKVGKTAVVAKGKQMRVVVVQPARRKPRMKFATAGPTFNDIWPAGRT